jgi:Cu+-exporting ATPase
VRLPLRISVPGKGIAALVDQQDILVGKPAFIEEKGIDLAEDLRFRIEFLGSEGKTVVVLARNNEVIGLIALQDTPRPGTRQVIEKLNRRHIRSVMLTGDSHQVAEAIGKSLGLSQVEAELLPADKAAAIEALQAKGQHVAMVGDGINDAPALAQSDVGIAIGAGTDVAIESAGVILIGDKLIDVLNALILGKASYRIMTGNVMVAVIFNVIGMILAALGLITPMLAIVVMILSIFVILLNTLRIRALRLETAEETTADTLSEVEFRIPDMVCEGCAETLSTALNGLSGVKKVKPKVM